MLLKIQSNPQSGIKHPPVTIQKRDQAEENINKLQGNMRANRNN